MITIEGGRKIVTTPVTDEDIRSIRSGDIIYLTGDMIACRDAAHKRVTEDGASFPQDLKGKALFHAGPIVREHDDGRFEIVSIGPTTSMRMEKFEYDFIKETGAKIIIGKGGMKENTERACRDFCAVHCAAPAGCAVVGALSVEEVTSADWLDLGMPEAVWSMKVRAFGPLFVTIDASSRNFFEEKKAEYNKKKDDATERIIREGVLI